MVFFHFVSDDQKSIILTAWNGEALKNCVANYAPHYPIDLAGNWVDFVRLRRPIIYNNFAESPNQKGVPEGHISIKRFMSIPIFENGKVQIVFGAGNKNDPYDEDDVVQLQLIANELTKIHKQRQAENTLRESEKKYRSLFENMLDCFAYCRIVFDEQGNPIDFVYLEINDAFERLTGLKREAVIGKRVTEAIPRIKKANPEVFEIYGRVALTCAGRGGHDIRNPLQAITGDVYLAKTDLATCPDSECKTSVQECLTEIEKNVDYINKIVVDFQDFARPLIPIASETNLKSIIDELIRNIPENIQVSRQVEKSTERIVADSDYVKRILTNLVSNAIQAMPSGGKLTVKAYHERNGMVLR